MKDPSMTETELLRQITALKKRIQELELSEAERARVEGELVISKKRLSRAEIISRCGNWEFDFNLNMVFGSEGAQRVYGLSNREWTIPEVQKIPLPEYRPMLDRALRGLVNENLPYNVEFRIKRPDTGEIIDIYSVAEYDPRRNVVFGVIQDITDRKRVEGALKESEERLNTILSNVGAYIYLKDTEYRYTYVNNKVCNLFGFKENEIVGKGDDSFFSPDSVEEIMRSDRRVIEQGETITREETDLTSLDNCPRTYWVVKLPLKDIHGNITGLCGISTDITDLKRAEEALQEAKDYTDNLIRSANALIVGLDTEGKVTLLNEAGEKMTGYKAADIAGKNWFELFVPGEMHSCAWDEFDRLKSAGTMVDTFEYPIVTRSGEERMISWKNSTLRQGGKFIGVISFGIDITERKGAEAEREKLILELQEALDKVRTLSGFLPICASCKRIRNDKGQWEQMEVYIRDRSEADFSHGICPECAQKLYPGFYKKK